MASPETNILKIRNDEDGISERVSAMAPPEGQVSNFINPENFGNDVFIVGYCFTTLALLLPV
jgi:hypothetical protein